jgi:hypothetical protein
MQIHHATSDWLAANMPRTRQVSPMTPIRVPNASIRWRLASTTLPRRLQSQKLGLWPFPRTTIHSRDSAATTLGRATFAYHLPRPHADIHTDKALTNRRHLETPVSLFRTTSYRIDSATVVSFLRQTARCWPSPPGIWTSRTCTCGIGTAHAVPSHLISRTTRLQAHLYVVASRILERQSTRTGCATHSTSHATLDTEWPQFATCF